MTSNCYRPTGQLSHLLQPGWVINPGGCPEPGPELKAQLKKQQKAMETEKLLREAQLRQADLVKSISEQETILASSQDELTKISKLIQSLQQYNND